MEVTKILWLSVLSLMGFFARAQFNTIKLEGEPGRVGFLETELSRKRDSFARLLELRTVEYNMGRLPLSVIEVTSPYGVRTHPITGKRSRHRGVDLRGVDKEVYAVQLGIVTEVAYDAALGQYIKLRSGTFEFIYGHLKHIYVSKGSKVGKGALIGRTGGTGKVTAEHLHFAIKKDGRFIDPYPILELIYGSLGFGLDGAPYDLDVD